MVLTARKGRSAVFDSVRNSDKNKLEFAESRQELESLFDLCLDCYTESKRMAFAPPTAFCVKKVRENEDKLTLAKNLHGENYSSQKHFNTRLELTPLQYNSKLMNSIWGLYNRYSPHNIKRTNDDFLSKNNFGGLTEPSANLNKVGASKEAANTSMGKGANKTQGQNIPNLWHKIPISQSH